MQQAHNFMKSVIDNFTVELFDEKKCTAWILNKLHPEGASCPRCGKPITSEKGLQNFWSLKRVFCKECKGLFTALTGTAINGIQMNLRILFVMAVFLQLGTDRKVLAKLLKIHPETVRFWEKKFKIMEDMGAEDDTGDGTRTN